MLTPEQLSAYTAYVIFHTDPSQTLSASTVSRIIRNTLASFAEHSPGVLATEQEEAFYYTVASTYYRACYADKSRKEEHA